MVKTVCIPKNCMICDHLVWGGDWECDWLECELNPKVDSDFLDLYKHCCDKFVLQEDLIVNIEKEYGINAFFQPIVFRQSVRK